MEHQLVACFEVTTSRGTHGVCVLPESVLIMVQNYHLYGDKFNVKFHLTSDDAFAPMHIEEAVGHLIHALLV